MTVSGSNAVQNSAYRFRHHLRPSGSRGSGGLHSLYPILSVRDMPGLYRAPEWRRFGRFDFPLLLWLLSVSPRLRGRFAFWVFWLRANSQELKASFLYIAHPGVRPLLQTKEKAHSTERSPDGRTHLSPVFRGGFANYQELTTKASFSQLLLSKIVQHTTFSLWSEFLNLPFVRLYVKQKRRRLVKRTAS
jgi:hypothetical protein